MSEIPLPMWVTLPGTVLLVLGGLTSLVGSLGLLRLRDFFMRMHATSMTTTVSSGAILIASILASTAVMGRPSVHELLITLCVLMSAPITAVVLLQAALHRNRERESEEKSTDKTS